MTCIAWDGKTLAADKRACFGDLARTMTKIHRVGKKLVGFAGSAAQSMEMLNWVKGGCKPDDFPESQRAADGWANVLVVSPGGVLEVYERTPYPIRLEDKIYAIGTGQHYALAAMYLGRSAVEAVWVAIAFDPGCGNDVDELRLK